MTDKANRVLQRSRNIVEEDILCDGERKICELQNIQEEMAIEERKTKRRYGRIRSRLELASLPVFSLMEELSHSIVGAEIDTYFEYDWERCRLVRKLKWNINTSAGEKYSYIEVEFYIQVKKRVFVDEYTSIGRYVCIIQGEENDLSDIEESVARAIAHPFEYDRYEDPAGRGEGDWRG